MSEAKFFKPEVPEIPEAERTPLVQALMAIVGQQQEHLQRQAKRNCSITAGNGLGLHRLSTLGSLADEIG